MFSNMFRSQPTSLFYSFCRQ